MLMRGRLGPLARLRIRAFWPGVTPGRIFSCPGPLARGDAGRVAGSDAGVDWTAATSLYADIMLAVGPARAAALLDGQVRCDRQHDSEEWPGRAA